jgi:hypothetical protein
MVEPGTLTVMAISALGVVFILAERLTSLLKPKRLGWRERLFVGMFDSGKSESSKLRKRG